jgi:hypothetical protein
MIFKVSHPPSLVMGQSLISLQSPPPPHSLISNFLPLMPPKIAKPLVTGSRYLNLLVQTYKDGALLVFLLGLTTIYAQWAHTPLGS